MCKILRNCSTIDSAMLMCTNMEFKIYKTAQNEIVLHQRCGSAVLLLNLSLLSVTQKRNLSMCYFTTLRLEQHCDKMYALG